MFRFEAIILAVDQSDFLKKEISAYELIPFINVKEMNRLMDSNEDFNHREQICR